MDNKNIFAKAEAYLSRQKELYGDHIHLNAISKDKSQVVENTDTKMPSKVKEKTSFKYNPEISSKKKPDLFTETPDWEKAGSIPELYDNIHNCMKCPLGKTRNKFVFGAGNPNADIMVIGEAPGADEDARGEPFVGRAGQLLTKILEAINLSRDEVFIGNIIKCRPPNNRRPIPEEVENCEPYLIKQIELIQPQFILALGLTAVDTLLKKKHKMGETRGKVLDYHGIKMLVTYHPAALLRNPNWKKLTWEDVQKLRAMYDDFLTNK